jgi:hypothetical protein
LGYILGELFRNSSGHTATNGPKMTLIKAAISIGLAYRKVNINNKNVTGSQKMRFTNKGWDLPRYVSDRVTRLGTFLPLVDCFLQGDFFEKY